MTFITIVIALVSFALIFFILSQNPQGGGIDSTLGGSQATHLFGASGSTEIVEKITWGLAAALFILCIVASLMVSNIGSAGEQLLSQ